VKSAVESNGCVGLGQYLPLPPNSFPFVEAGVLDIVLAVVALRPATAAVCQVIFAVKAERSDDVAAAALENTAGERQLQLHPVLSMGRDALQEKTDPRAARKTGVGFRLGSG
jgi:hypothetical protein